MCVWGTRAGVIPGTPGTPAHMPALARLGVLTRLRRVAVAVELCG